jgi:hyperpolarization activated cyclic nucleotide-gated potassium channel 2
MTTVGYGDITPCTPLERCFGILFLLIATGVFSFTLNTIGAALQQIEDKKQCYRRQMSEVNRYMKRVKLNTSTQNKLRRYLSYIWDSGHAVDLSEIVQVLNEQL